VGGSQGAEALNRVVLEVVRESEAGGLKRPEGTTLLWATGPKHLEGIRVEVERLGATGWVHLHGFIQEMPQALRAATLAISRAGAMATSEFLACGVPVILVPLPTAAADHQRRNAESLAAAGTAVHLPQSELSASALWREVVSLLTDPDELEGMRRAALEMGRPEATRRIAEALEGLLPRPELRPSAGGVVDAAPPLPEDPPGIAEAPEGSPPTDGAPEGGRG